MDIARLRLRNQGISRPLGKTPLEVVRSLVASQAQDFAGAKWAVGLRTPKATDAIVERAFDSGEILRTHVMRPTWHFVAQEDLRWLLSLTAHRVHAVNGPRYRELGLDAKTLAKATTVLTRALEGGRELTRDELRAALARAKIAADGQRMAYILMHAELEAALCSGARRGKQFTYAHFDERAPRARRLARNDALEELARRYFRSRGPATAHDFAKWSGLTLADARAGLEAVAPELERVERGRVVKTTVAHLLSIYDEYISSYRDRTAICEPAYAKRLAGMGSALGYVLVVDGQIAGTWRRMLQKKGVRVELSPLRKLSATELRACHEAATRFARFLGEAFALDLAITK